MLVVRNHLPSISVHSNALTPPEGSVDFVKFPKLSYSYFVVFPSGSLILLILFRSVYSKVVGT